MQNYKKTLLLGLITTLTACSFVSLNPNAKDVIVLENTDTLKQCKFLGNTTVSVWNKAETFQSNTTVITQLDTLARNQAVTMGGNRVTPNSAITDGQRTYSVYNCSSH
jgi:hypothetical protein